jgi:hypothetical protein
MSFSIKGLDKLQRTLEQAGKAFRRLMARWLIAVLIPMMRVL